MPPPRTDRCEGRAARGARHRRRAVMRRKNLPRPHPAALLQRAAARRHRRRVCRRSPPCSPYYDVDRSFGSDHRPGSLGRSRRADRARCRAPGMPPPTAAREPIWSATTPRNMVLRRRRWRIWHMMAASVAKVILSPPAAISTILTQPGGFVGTDGWFALAPDGQVRRGLAVYRVERAGPETDRSRTAVCRRAGSVTISFREGRRTRPTVQPR